MGAGDTVAGGDIGPKVGRPGAHKHKAHDKSASTSSRKRKAADMDERIKQVKTPKSGKASTTQSAGGASKAKGKGKKTANSDVTKEKSEKRLRRFRDHAPQSFVEIWDRAMTQRMFVINRKRTGTYECPQEVVDIAGTTGNVYTVNIGPVPSCTCPHARKGNQCKHIVYVLVRTLKAPSHLQYQLAFLSSELHQIFASAPPIPSADSSATDGKRKAVEGDCPICCVEFEPQKEKIVYCKAACGNNIHQKCFDQWAATKPGQVTCPYCRTPWEGEMGDLKKVATQGRMNEEGYVNVASQLGISGVRDYSSYHRPWVSRQYRRAGYFDDYP
ncbi:hypothetical protein BDY21DRAFT_332668 [Lineolata rhizophorae]|uniref:RING finger domain-containing protein n=1 Tax=Lineolata rhizophorae TaxID=578093 RepID=A0A6A6PC89_9PEZI|nr:hypothetical protein BDY21DRAFT_332668 [Lineolata rhizophorae]